MFSPACTGSGSIGHSPRCSSSASCGQCSGADLSRTERRSAQRVASEVARRTVRTMAHAPVLELGGGLPALVNGRGAPPPRPCGPRLSPRRASATPFCGAADLRHAQQRQVTLVSLKFARLLRMLGLARMRSYDAKKITSPNRSFEV